MDGEEGEGENGLPAQQRCDVPLVVVSVGVDGLDVEVGGLASNRVVPDTVDKALGARQDGDVVVGEAVDEDILTGAVARGGQA